MDDQSLTVSINGQAVKYHARQTTAPKDFDGFGTIELADCGTERIVLIRDEHYTWQTARYSSGLHVTDAAFQSTDDITNEIWRRINGRAE